MKAHIWSFFSRLVGRRGMLLFLSFSISILRLARAQNCPTDGKFDVFNAEDASSVANCLKLLESGVEASVSWHGKVQIYAPIELPDTLGSLSVVGATSDAVVDGGGAVQLFTMPGGGTLQLQQLELRNGSAPDFGGGIFCDGAGNVSLSNVTVNSCNSVESGGGIYLAGSCSLNSQDTVFVLNHGGENGGAVASAATAPITLNGCRLENNSAALSGGALHHFSGNLLNSHPLTVLKSSFSDNAALGGLGGGAYAQEISVSASNFTRNKAKQFGGAIATYDVNGAKVAGCTFLNNSAAVDGGAIRGPIVDFPQLQPAMTTIVSGSTFLGNTAVRYGAGIYSSRIEATDCSFARGSSARGGAIHSADVNLTRIDVTNCTAAQNGGAVFLDGGLGVSFKAIESSFTGCNASIAGGAVFRLSIEDSTFAIDPAADRLTFAGNHGKCCFQPSLGGADAEYTCQDADGSGALDACCPAGQRVDGATCAVCSQGWDCAVPGYTEGTMPLLPGYWKADFTTLEARECFSNDACVGGVAFESLDELCKTGNKGPYCAVCSSGYYSTGKGSACKECHTSKQAGIIALIVLLLISILGVMWLLTWADPTGVSDQAQSMAGSSAMAGMGVVAKAVQALPLEKLRFPLVAIQIVVQYVAITGIRFPPLFETFVSWCGVLTLELGWVFSASCAWDLNFYDRLLALTLVPMAIAGLFAGSYAWRKRKNAADAERMERSARRHLLGLLVLTFFVYSSVSAVTFQTFACDDLGFLRADYSIRCETPTHRAYSVYAGFMAVLYAGGIPLFYLGLLWRHRRSLHDPKGGVPASRKRASPPPALKTTRFLWHPYRGPFFYWEVVECVRRLLLTGTLAFIMPNTPGQAAVACLLAVLTLGVYAAFWPLEDTYDTYSYVLGCMIIFLSMYLGLIMDAQVAADDDTSGVTLSVVVIVITVLLVTFTFLQIGFSAHEGYTRAREGSFLGMGNSQKELQKQARRSGASELKDADESIVGTAEADTSGAGDEDFYSAHLELRAPPL